MGDPSAAASYVSDVERYLREVEPTSVPVAPPVPVTPPPSAPAPIELTAEQNAVVSEILAGVKGGIAEQTLGGFAGTGKTTVIKTLVSKLGPGWAVCAFTGKAANVLRRKGVSATTIHSLIYRPERGECDECGHYTPTPLGPDLKPDKKCMPTHCARCKAKLKLRWVRADRLESYGIIVDEASMVSADVYRDLVAFSLPVIFVGDHGQLEPVGSKFNLMEDPQFRLETIHRNAGDIANFAEALRLEDRSRARRILASSREVQHVGTITDDVLRTADQVCVAFNKSRVRYNKRIRQMLGRTALVEVGERVMCLRNNRDLGLFNGQQGVVTRVSDTKPVFDFDDGTLMREGVDFLPEQFNAEKSQFEFGDRSANPFDYGYTATAHKLQGDEADAVLVVPERCDFWEMRRWEYTAATRARRLLLWAGDK